MSCYGAPVYVRKQIVHNKHVVATLEAQGAIFVEETDEVPEGAIVVLLRARRRPQRARRGRRSASCRTIDATCPLVTKVHHEARRFAAEDYDILLIGHAGHEEVVGTTGEAPDRVTLVDGPEDADHVAGHATPTQVVWLSQTTLSVDETLETVRPAAQAVPAAESTRRATTSATPPRTVRARSSRSPPTADLVIVVGSAQLVELGAAGRGRA